MIFIAGGAGFILNNFALDCLAQSDGPAANLDNLTYGSNPESLGTLKDDARHVLVQGDLCNCKLVDALLAQHRQRAVLHFAAESHGDFSIYDPGYYSQFNIVSTFRLLESLCMYRSSLSEAARSTILSLRVCADKAYASLSKDYPQFTKTNAYEPISPYLVSKTCSDHLVRAWYHNYGLPVLTTNCSNNYIPYLFPKKLIPSKIVNALTGHPLPVLGASLQVCDWLYVKVKDRGGAFSCLLEAGRLGETYRVGDRNENPTPRSYTSSVPYWTNCDLSPTGAATKRKSTSCKTASASTYAAQTIRARSNANWARSQPKPSRPRFARRCSGILTTQSGSSMSK